MNKSMFYERRTGEWVAAIAAVVIMSACVDDWDNRADGGGDVIRLVHAEHLDYVDSRTGRSNGDEYMPLTMIKEDSLFVRSRQNDWEVDWKPEKNAASRAIKQEGDYDGFYMNAYAMDGQQEAVMVHQRVEVNDKSMDYSPVCRWPGDRKVCFYAWAARNADGPYALQTPVWSVTNDTEGNPVCSAQFSYSIPASTGQEGVYNDASVQPDIILGMAPSKTHEDNPVVMNFQHALAAVHFKISSVPEGTTITRVEIMGVAGGGTCTYTGSSEAGAMQIAWKTDGTSRSFSQSFTWTDEGEMALTDNNTTFAMVPQTLGTDAKVRVYFTVGEAEYVSIASLNGRTWSPGKKYTYTITTREYAEVQFGEEVEEEVTGKMEEVVVHNTGLVKVYVRAAVVGYWQNDEGVILMPWDIEDENVGIVTWGEGWTDAWGKNQKAADGWYYHKKPVDIGCYTEKPLIESYVLTANPPMMDAHLEFNVIVQIVEEENVEEEWNVTIVDGQVMVI